MQTFSATDFAIRSAAKRGSLTLTERASRFAGETYVAIADEHGIIEVQPTMGQAQARVRECA